MLFKWLVFPVLFTLSSFIAEAKKGKHNGGKGKSSSVGNFKISISDSQIPNPQINETLWETLVNLYVNYYEVWASFPGTFPPAEEAINITRLANQSTSDLNAPDSVNVISSLLPIANESLINDRKRLMTEGCTGYLIQQGYCEPDEVSGLILNNATSVTDYMNNLSWDLGSEYLSAVYNATILTDVFNQAALMGVGETISCSDNIDTVLGSKSEWAKTTSSMATTIMAILPTLLAFGTFYVPRSSEVFATSTLVGLGSAVYSLGLPVKSMTAIPDEQTLSLTGLGFAALVTITSYGTLNKAKEKYTKRHLPDPKLKDLREWSNPNPDQIIQTYNEISVIEAKYRFSRIRNAVEDWELRRHWWMLPALIFTGIQAAVFAVAIAPLLGSRGAPRFIYSCGHTTWTSYYLAISAVANAVFRLFMWETGYHERVNLYHLSKTAHDKLSSIVMSNDNRKEREDRSVEKELPPLYPPWLELIVIKWDNLLDRIGYDSFRDRIGFRREHSIKYHEPRAGNLSEIIPTMPWHWHMAHFRSTFKTAPTMIRSEFIPTRKDKPLHDFSACRWRPLIILIHQDVEGRSKFKTFLIGFIESMLLLVLTFFFAAHWAGNLKVTLFALVMLVVFISVGRLVGFLYVVLSAKFWGLHVINFSVNGASYFNGYRLEGFKGYNLWRNEYEMGRYDHVARAEDEDEDKNSQNENKAGTFSVDNRPTSEGDAELGAIHEDRGERLA